MAERERVAMSLAAGTEMTRRQTAVRDVTMSRGSGLVPTVVILH